MSTTAVTKTERRRFVSPNRGVVFFFMIFVDSETFVDSTRSILRPLATEGARDITGDIDNILSMKSALEQWVANAKRWPTARCTNPMSIAEKKKSEQERLIYQMEWRRRGKTTRAKIGRLKSAWHGRAWHGRAWQAGDWWEAREDSQHVTAAGRVRAGKHARAMVATMLLAATVTARLALVWIVMLITLAPGVTRNLAVNLEIGSMRMVQTAPTQHVQGHRKHDPSMTNAIHHRSQLKDSCRGNHSHTARLRLPLH